MGAPAEPGPSFAQVKINSPNKLSLCPDGSIVARAFIVNRPPAKRFMTPRRTRRGRNTSSIGHFEAGIFINMSMKFGREVGSEMEVSKPAVE
jgi:hypothetical protein